MLISRTGGPKALPDRTGEYGVCKVRGEVTGQCHLLGVIGDKINICLGGPKVIIRQRHGVIRWEGCGENVVRTQKLRRF